MCCGGRGGCRFSTPPCGDREVRPTPKETTNLPTPVELHAMPKHHMKFNRAKEPVRRNLKGRIVFRGRSYPWYVPPRNRTRGGLISLVRHGAPTWR